MFFKSNKDKDKSSTRKCPQCEAEVSTTAKKCKHCGSKLPVQMTKIRLITTIIIVIFIMYSCSQVLDDYETVPQSTSQKTVNRNPGIALVCIQNKVESLLISPSTAKFPWGLEAVPVGDGYMLSSYVDSQNGFGAMVRTNFVCTAKVINSNNYQCETECVFE